MKTTILPAFAAACALTLAGPAYAQHGHEAQAPHALKAHAPVNVSQPATHGARVHGAQAHRVAGVHGNAAVHGSASHASVKPPKTSHEPDAHAAAARTDSIPPGTRPTPVQQKLRTHAKLAARLQSDLPRGVTVQAASSGFRNLGQFVAAVNVSRNLGIPFADLKARMTGDDALSLGQAIKALRPDVDARAESRAAERQAEMIVAAHS